MLKHILSFTLLSLSLSIEAQVTEFVVSITEGGRNLSLAGAGGFNYPQFSAIDLNDDQIQDLLVYDRDGHIAIPFINNGTPNQVDYQYAPDYIGQFPQRVENYMLARDFDQDGIEDLFYYSREEIISGAIGVLKGSYDAANRIQFTPFDYALKYDNGQKIHFSNSDFPAFDDIDDDGDLDIVVPSQYFGSTSYFSWYRNTSVERGWGSDSLIFVLETSCLGLMNVNFDSLNTATLSNTIDSCGAISYWSPRSSRHSGLALYPFDQDNDGVKDYFISTWASRHLTMLKGQQVNLDNQGIDSLLLNQEFRGFPAYDNPVDIFSFPIPFVLDVNNDNKDDLLVAVNESTLGESLKDSTAQLYLNTNSNQNKQFSRATINFLGEDMVDVGFGASPAFFDYNQDGLLDMVIANAMRVGPGFGFSSLSLYENTGTAQQAAYTLVNTDYGNLAAFRLKYLHPVFVDIDADGDEDLFLGDETGYIHYIENTGGTGTAQWATPVLQYRGIKVSANAAPHFADLDRDGDQDLLIGEYLGTIQLFDNKGDASTANFSSAATIALVGDVNVNTLNYADRNACPVIIDRGNDFELIVSTERGFVHHYNNVENNLNGNFTPMTTTGIDEIYVGKGTKIALADLNGAGEAEIVLGNIRGGVSFIEYTPIVLETNQVDNKATSLLVYPNPSRGVLTVEFEPISQNQRLFVLNALGQVCMEVQLEAGEQKQVLNVKDLASGVYYIQLRGGNGMEHYPFVKQ